MVTDHSKVVKHYQRSRVRNYKKLNFYINYNDLDDA